ncbi:TetR/AcrR family transcriptional regulator [Novipirellula aureliae]|nr:TetR/AcrR family transcriptional regulator [Novipirellula aureliae]
MNAKHSETRNHILRTGRIAIAQKGFTALGLAELLRVADVPKGSFYHYFKSKEHFGCIVITEYIEEYAQTLDALLDSSKGTVAQQLLDYFTDWIETQSGDIVSADAPPEARCLVVKLSAEIADLSVEMREALHRGTSELISRLAAIIDKGFTDGSITSDQSSTQLAECLYEVWLGASLLEKLRQDGTSFETALCLSRRLLQ